MTPRQKIFALTVGIAVFFAILRLVYTRRLREEFSWLWLLTGTAIVGLVVFYDALVAVTNLIGAVLPTTTLFLFGMLFLVGLNLYFSIKISALTNEVRILARKLAILEGDPAAKEPEAPGGPDAELNPDEPEAHPS